MHASVVRAIVLLAVLAAAPAPAQQAVGDLVSQAELERIRTEKKAWIALNMEFAPGEAEAFWPLYESYQGELSKINVRVIRLMQAYAEHYRNNSLTDDLARKLTEEALALDEAEVKLRRSYFARLTKALSARKAARYLQLEGRVHTQVRYELGANLPLVGDVRPRTPGAAPASSAR